MPSIDNVPGTFGGLAEEYPSSVCNSVRHEGFHVCGVYKTGWGRGG